MRGTNLRPGDKRNFVALDKKTYALVVLAKLCVGEKADLVEFSVEGDPGRKIRIWLEETPEGKLVQKEETIIIGL